MKQTALFFFFIITCIFLAKSQQEEQHKFNLSAGIGYALYTTYDPILNYYTYSGSSFLPISLSGEYHSNQNLFFINIFSNNAEIKPRNIRNDLYEHNYIRQWNADLNLEYYREIARIQKYIRVYAGCANNSFVILQEEFYNNLLFEYGEGYRKSYTLTPFCVSANLLMQIDYNKNFLRLKTGYTVLNLSARPDDNFVKQFGVNDAATWKFYIPGNHAGLRFSLYYQYNYWPKTGITAEYNFCYQSFSSPADFKYLRMLFLIGINTSL
jgi:hypothetical protein